MNKNIKTELAIGIILTTTLIIGGLIWLTDKQANQKQVVTPVVQSTTPTMQPANEAVDTGKQELLVQSEIRNGVEVKIIDNKKEHKYTASISGKTLDEFSYPENFSNTIEFRFEGLNYLVIFYEPAMTPGWDNIYNLNTLEKIKTELMNVYISNDEKYIVSYSLIREGSIGLVVEKIGNRNVKKWISKEEVSDVKISGDILEYKEFKLEDTDWSPVKKVDLSKL